MVAAWRQRQGEAAALQKNYAYLELAYGPGILCPDGASSEYLIMTLGITQPTKRVARSIALAIPGAICAVVLRKALQVWGILDPFAVWLGGWLRIHITPAQAEWTVAAALAVIGYCVAIWLFWRHAQAPGWGEKDGASLVLGAHNEVKKAEERARILKQLALVKDAGTKMLDPVTIAGIWAGTLNPHETTRHLYFRAIKEAITQGKLPGTILKDGKVNKDARVPIASLEKFWIETGVIDGRAIQEGISLASERQRTEDTKAASAEIATLELELRDANLAVRARTVERDKMEAQLNDSPSPETSDAYRVADGNLGAALRDYDAIRDKLLRVKGSLPKEPAYMTAYEVIHYLADESEWGERIKSVREANNIMPQYPMRRQPLLEAPIEFKRVAEQGGIGAFGRLDGRGAPVPIPGTHWMVATISSFSLGSPDISETVPAVPNADGIPEYKDVRIVREDVYRAWPSRLGEDE